MPEQSQSPSHGIPGWVRVLFGLPLVALGGFVTFAFGLALCLYITNRLSGGARAYGFIGHCFTWLFFGAAPLAVGKWLLQHSAKAPFSKRFCLGVSLLLVVLGADATLGPRNWRGLFRRERVVQADAFQLPRTFVIPHLEAEIRPGTNLLWCGTFQLAWNEACALAGGDLQLVDASTGLLRQHPMTAALNQHAFTKDCVDESSYVAMAGFVKDKIHEKIVSAVQSKLAFQPRVLPEKALTPRPQDFVAYACLWKRLSFAVPFECLEDAFHFGGQPVRAFGMGKTKASHATMCPQVSILDYQNEDDFVVELKTTSSGNRLVLAKVQPKDNLGELVTTVRKRVVNCPGEPAGTNDVLVVPRVSLDLTRKYSELENCWLVPQGRKVARDLLLRSALQTIKFEMNERGVELRSEAHMAFGCAQEPRPVRNHTMIFDKPFLILLERQNASMPYFVLWVDNPEFLMRW